MTIRAGFVSALLSAVVWTVLIISAARPASAQPAGPAGETKAAQNNSPTISPANNPPAAAEPLPAPFNLNLAEQANLDQLLKDWEQSSSSIKTFTCKFTRMEYDPA